MIRSVQAPIRTETENQVRGAAMWAIRARKTADKRKAVRAILDATFPRVRLVLASGRENRMEIVLRRISPGELDDDAPAGVMKSIRDEIAAWIGLDDRNPRMRWEYEQQRCEPGYMGILVEIVDLDDAPDVIRVLGDAPRRVGAPARVSRHERPTAPPPPPKKPAKPRATSLGTLGSALVRAGHAPPVEIVRPSFSLLPWDQIPGALAVLTEEFEGIADPPLEHTFTEARARARLYRHAHFHPELGHCWLYTQRRPGE